MTEENRKRTAWDKVMMARRPERTRAQAYIDALFDGFMELHGDRLYGDDQALLAGVGFFHGQALTRAGEQRSGDRPRPLPNVSRFFQTSKCRCCAWLSVREAAAAL